MTNKFKIQYEINGKTNEKIRNTIESSIKRIESIITESNNNNYNYKGILVKDIYLIFNLTDRNILEDDGFESHDTLAASKIKVIKQSKDNIFPVIAEIELNENSVNKSTVIHEILHSLGHGFLWKNVQNNNYIGPKLDKYNGKSATVYHSNYNDNIPLDEDKMHFHEDIDDIMVARNHSNRISKLTIGNLEDLGYKVDYSKADRELFDYILFFFIIVIIYIII